MARREERRVLTRANPCISLIFFLLLSNYTPSQHPHNTLSSSSHPLTRVSPAALPRSSPPSHRSLSSGSSSSLLSSSAWSSFLGPHFSMAAPSRSARRWGRKKERERERERESTTKGQPRVYRRVYVVWCVLHYILQCMAVWLYGKTKHTNGVLCPLPLSPSPSLPPSSVILPPSSSFSFLRLVIGGTRSLRSAPACARGTRRTGFPPHRWAPRPKPR